MPTFIETQSHLGTTATCLPELVEQLGQPPPILMIVGKRAEKRCRLSSIVKRDRRPLLAAEAMRRIYSETLDLLEDDGYHVFDQRYRLSNLRKARLVASAWTKGPAGPPATATGSGLNIRKRRERRKPHDPSAQPTARAGAQ